MNDDDLKTSFQKLDESVDELKEVMIELVEDFLEDFLSKANDWWETGKDNLPKASDLVDRLREKMGH